MPPILALALALFGISISGPLVRLSGEHPIVIAQRIMERFARTNDDALVLVSR